VGHKTAVSLFRRKPDPLRAEFESDAMTHLDALYGNAMRLTRSPADAEDLVQETFLKAYRFYDRFERGTNMRAWLFRIQYNTFVNHYRRSVRAQAASDTLKRDPAGQQLVGRSALRALTDSDSVVLRPLVAREIGAALDSLPEEHRIVVVLADIEGFAYKEIAEVVGCPIGTVMSRLHRARRTLRGLLVDHARHLGLAQDEQGEAEDGGVDPVSLDAYRRDRSGQ
jgi:RNA polymerase sigma-70 factor (ECF subfamily)